MTLTSEHLATLQRPFALNDHEFLKDLVYITEGAITTRIEEVDPAWELTGLGITHRNTFGSDVQVTVIVRLTICGVSREGVGSAKVIGKTGTWEGKYPNKKFTPLPPEEHSEVNEAEKSAATDALKRAARLFGIGRYLLNLPDDVKDKESLARYFNQQPTAPPAQTPPKTAAASPKNNGSSKPRATTSAAPEKALTDGETRQITLTAVISETGKVGQTRYRFASVERLEGVYAYSREVFINGGWCTENDWQKHGTYDLPAACMGTVKYHAFAGGDGGYWTVEAVENFQPDFLKDVEF